MSEHDPEAAPPEGPPRPVIIEHEPTPDPARPAPPPPRRRGGTPFGLFLLVVLALGGGIYWTWTHPKPATTEGEPDQSAEVGSLRTELIPRLDGATQQLQALAGRMDKLEQRPAPAADSGDTAKRLDDLSGRLAKLEQQPPPAPDADLAKRLDDVAGRVAKLEQQPPPPPPAADPDAAKRLDELSARLAKLEAQPAPANPDVVGALTKRLDDLSSRLDAASAKQDAQASDLQKVQAEVAGKPAPPPIDPALAQLPAVVAKLQDSDHDSQAQVAGALAQQKTALDALDGRLGKLEGAPAPPDPTPALAQQKDAIGGLEQRLAKLEGGVEQARQTEASQTDAARAQDAAALSALDGRVTKLEQGAGAVQGVAQDASRAIRLQAAQAALAAGQKLGPLPGAPPALARFADAPPPTEASLRAAFPQVAAAARAASEPDLQRRSFFDRALARLQQSVTVRQGDHVLVGDPAAGVLARAQQSLDNGDLRGAADTLDDLNGPAKAATRDWVAQVHALLDARAALAAMARG